MTDTVKAWIEERRAVLAKATPGEWQADGFADELGGEPIIRLSIWSGPPSRKESPIVVHSIRHHGNTGFILDAHNMFPRALDALEAVLDLHRATPVYEVAEMCENEDEDHQDSRHWEAEDGTLLCEDLPTGDTNCRWCCDEDGDPIDWPCFTVKVIQQAIEGAINE